MKGLINRFVPSSGLKNGSGKFAAVSVLLVFLFAAAFWTTACAPSGQNQSPAPAQTTAKPAEPKETTIRNVTGDTVSYTIRSLYSDAGPVKKTIEPDAIDRFPGATALDIEFSNGAETKSYRLDQGKAYSFRLDENDQLELFDGAHGRADAVDLAPFVPTPMPVVEKMLEMAQLDSADVIYDIGCGDGRIIITAAKKYGARGVGVDIVPERIQACLSGAKEAGVENLVEFKQQDAMTLDISPATVVTLYLLPESNILLRPKLETQLKPGTLVISHNYSIAGWEKKEVRSESLKDEKGVDHSVYIYKKRP